ncbi:uncharacterized protein LOC141685510 [Apium graveolens]|uniref:uncharacterized protein LOC141685510 n=1 Tax=Apium graveolens TaxID=4045 RepID=UPI003D7A9AB0
MGPPTLNQRLEEIEGKVAGLESSISTMVSNAVEKAIEAMRHSLTKVLIDGQNQATKKLGTELEIAAGRLEGRISRSREYQESLINTMRNEQIKFQAEVRSTLTEFQTFQAPANDKLEGSVNQPASGIAGMNTHVQGFPTPLLGFDEGGLGYRVRQWDGYGGGGGRNDGGGYGGGGSVSGPGNWRFRKLDMPLFDGSDPDGWILRVERYFQFYKLAEEEMLNAVAVALEGDALRWYQWENKRHPIRHWSDLKTFVLKQFRSASGGSLYEQWLSTVQTTSVSEYSRKFIETASPLDRIPENILMGQYINGLKDEVKVEVRLLNPVSLEQAMKVATRVEERNSVTGGGKSGLSSIRPGPFPSFSKGSSSVSNQPYGLPTSPPVSRAWSMRSNESQASVQSPTTRSPSRNVPGGIKRLTERELQDKRAKGLCYRCDAKWSIGHRCQKKELSVLLIEEEDESEGEEGDNLPSPTEEVTTEVSLNSVIGLTNPKTMKLKGSIGEYEVVVLIDPGATHNFVSLELVKELGIPVEPTGSFGVCLGNGDSVQGDGMCRKVRLQLKGGIEVVSDFLPLGLGNSDVILGVQWLETLGVVMTDWKKQEMTYNIQGKPVTLVGDPSLIRSRISLKAMIKSLKKIGGGFVVECRQMEALELQQAEKVRSQSSGEVTKESMFLTDILQRHAKVFEEPKGLPPKRNHEHAIRLKGGSEPVGVRPYRYPQCQKDEIERLIKDMLAAGIIKPSTSPFSSPVLLVKKKDGSWRFCVDYRALNKETIPDKYPIPVIDELLDELSGAFVFSKIDLKAGYHQIRVQEEDTHKTAFRTHDEHYEFLVMPFGLTNAPATFQSLMNDVFRPFLRKFVLVFFDDILVYSKSREEHVNHLQQVLEKLEEHKLVANRKKCEFGKESIGYLGHVISRQGVEVDKEKVTAILEWPQPTNIRELRSFLGMTGYYRKFVSQYAQIAHPLTEQLKRDNYGWNEAATQAFSHLKKALTTAPVLLLPNFKQPFIVETDASGYGVEAVLMQQNRPVAFFSKLLGTRGQQKSSLRFLTQQREISAEYKKWVAKLLGFDFEIQFKLGAANRVADALSRKRTGEVVLCELVSTHGVSWEQLSKEVEADRDLQLIIQGLKGEEGETSKFHMVHGELRYKGRMVVPRSSKVIPSLLEAYHDSPVGGHAGEVKMYLRIAKDWYWKGMRGDVTTYVRQCVTCQQQKVSQQAPAGLLQPLPIPSLVWDDITMDFIEGLPMSQGYNDVLVVVDRLTKYAHFLGLRHPFDAFSVAAVFTKEIVKLHGFPRSIVSDRDRIFVSTFWRELFKLQGSKLKHSTAYHPQTDGQSENVNKGFETYLRCFVGALYGREAPPILRMDRGQATVNSVEEMLLERDYILDYPQFHLHRSQQRMKHSANAHRRDANYVEGDWIIKKVGVVAYQLELPKDSRIHPVFHVSQLKRAVGQVPANPTIPTQLTEELELLVEPEEVLEVRQVKQGSNLKLEVLIQLKGLPKFEAPWEEVERAKLQFPDFHLEDKVNLWGQGNVMHQIAVKQPIMYSRKKNRAVGAKGPITHKGQG